MAERRAWGPIIGSMVFFLLAPGTVAGWAPYWFTGWRMQPPLLGLPGVRVAGALLVALGLSSLVESFVRFVTVGLGTPAPIAPPTRLVVSGQYRHVRNPMYVAILAMLVGQSLILGSMSLLRYALAVGFGFNAWVLIYEEPKLMAQFGASYQAYRKHVHRWWPRLRPWSA